MTHNKKNVKNKSGNEEGGKVGSRRRNRALGLLRGEIQAGNKNKKMRERACDGEIMNDGKTFLLPFFSHTF